MRFDPKQSVSPAVFRHHRFSVSSPFARVAESSCPMTSDSRFDTDSSSVSDQIPESSAHRLRRLPCCSSPFYRLPELLAVKYSTVLPDPLSSSISGWPNESGFTTRTPFALSAFTDFLATTKCSAPWCRIRTFALVVQSTWSFSVGIDSEGSHVPCNRLAQDQVTYMPDTIPPVARLRRNLSRSLLTNRGFDIVLAVFDMNAR